MALTKPGYTSRSSCARTSSQDGSTAALVLPVTRTETSWAAARMRATTTTVSYVVSGSSARTAVAQPLEGRVVGRDAAVPVDQHVERGGDAVVEQGRHRAVGVVPERQLARVVQPGHDTLQR